jgi:hypothetical protein
MKSSIFIAAISGVAFAAAQNAINPCAKLSASYSQQATSTDPNGQFDFLLPDSGI